MGVLDSMQQDLKSFEEYQKQLASKAIITDTLYLPIKFIGGFDINFRDCEHGGFVGQADLVVFE